MSEQWLSRRQVLGGFAAVSALGILAACDTSSGLSESSSSKEGSPSGPRKSNKNYVVAMKSGNLSTLDPSLANTPGWLIVGPPMYDRLIMEDPADFAKLKPMLAESYTMSDDGLEYVFNLRSGLKFSDGSAASVADMIFSLERIFALKVNSSRLQVVDSIRQTGDNQLTLRLSEPYSDLLQLLTNPSMGMTNAAAVKRNGGTTAEDAPEKDTADRWFREHSAGTGPYTLTSWEPNSSLTLGRNKHYWGTPPGADSIRFQFVESEQAELQLLAAGTIDIATGLTSDTVSSLSGEPNVEVLHGNGLGLAYLGWSVKNNPAFRNPKTWEAVKYAIDYKGLAAIYGKGGYPVGSCLPDGIPGALPAAEGLEEDLDRAKAALKAAGYAKGFSFRLSYGSDAIYTSVPAQPVVEKLAADLERVGIHAVLDPKLETQFLTEYRAGKPEAIVTWIQPVFAGWSAYLPGSLQPGGIVGLARHQWAADSSPEAEQIVAVLKQATSEVDEVKRIPLIEKSQRLMNEFSPYAWLFGANFLTGIRTDSISHLDLSPSSYFNANTVKLA